MTRERYIHPTSEIPHLWAHQTKPKASNPQRNLYFDGPTIYSYRDSWPLARIYTRRGRTLVLSNSSRYGVTTSQNQQAVNWSVNHLDQVAVPVPCVSYPRDHDANITFLVTEQARLLKEAQRCMQENSVTYRERVARERYYAQIRYQAFFGIRRKVTAFPEDAWQAAQDRARRIETPDPVRDAKRLVA